MSGQMLQDGEVLYQYIIHLDAFPGDAPDVSRYARRMVIAENLSDAVTRVQEYLDTGEYAGMGYRAEIGTMVTVGQPTVKNDYLRVVKGDGKK